MKRFIVRAFMVAAVLALGSSAFAQLTFNGYYRTGGTFYVPTSGSNAFEYGDRLRLNVSYVAQDDLFGAKFRLQGNGETQPGITQLFLSTGTKTVVPYGIEDAFMDASSLQYGFAYVNLFGGIVKATMGKLDITDYEVAQKFVANQFFGNVYTDELKPGAPLLGGQKGNTTGAMVQVKPMDGLSVAAFSRIDTSDTGTTPDIGAHELGFSAYYKLPDLGTVTFNSSLGHNTLGSNSAYDDNLSRSYVSAAFSYTGFKNLIASAGLRYDGDTVYNSKANAATSLIAIVDYDFADMSLPMTLDLAGDFDFVNSYSYFEGEVNYVVIPQVKVRAYGEYDSTETNGTGIAKLNFAAKANNYTLGADLVFPAGKAAEIDAGILYGDVTNIAYPILAKVNF